ncbi:MAG TPA: endonuclease III [Spirochaetales bacterium]|nr:endonuclease III [Spirochaetales bacterium]
MKRASIASGKSGASTASSLKKEIPWDNIFTRLYDLLKHKPLPAVSEVARKNHDPFRVLVSTMISLRTKDEVTAAASARLLSHAPNPAALSRLRREEIASLIYPAGFYRTKAKNLKEAARLLLSRFDSRVPANLENLLSLPGVGRKTANLVLNLGFNIEGICVDTHVHRIANRLGWIDTTNPEKSEYALMEILPRKYWIAINELLVQFGQQHCTPLSPRCSACPVHSYCVRRKVTSRR